MQTLIKPFCKGLNLYNQIKESIDTGTADSFDVWWLGQSGFLIQWNRKCILFDPYLSDSLTKKYDGTEKPHVRISELVIEPELLDCIHVVTSSHNHTDHLDAETLIPILRINPNAIFVIPEANRKFVAGRIKCENAFPIGLNDREKIVLNDLTLHGVPAAHNSIERDEGGRLLFMGYVLEFGKFKVYHSGDTLWYDDIVERLRPFAVDVAFLPINGNDSRRGVAGNLNCEEAARLGRAIDARWVVPHHYDLFEFNTADPREFIREAEKYAQPYKVLQLGEEWTVV
jgi:L-ascorbate metabolism protein UlaG (beta-lactamase superfamily)